MARGRDGSVLCYPVVETIHRRANISILIFLKLKYYFSCLLRYKCCENFTISMCRENICHIVKSPASVSWKFLQLATEVAYKAVSSLEGAGIFAVELFLTADGQVVH